MRSDACRWLRQPWHRRPRPRRIRGAAPAPASSNSGSPELAYAGVEAGAPDERKGWGIIEID
jgi:hypothetical protein